MKSLAVVLMLLISGCDELYSTDLPEGMVLTETHYTDPQKLWDACGGMMQACARTDFVTFCDIHLGLAANGEPMDRDHELSHCAGRKDAPPVGDTNKH